MLGLVVSDPRLVLLDKGGLSASTVSCKEARDPASSRFRRKNCDVLTEGGMSSHFGMRNVWPGE